MKAFPLKTFWDNIIIVNTQANLHDESYTDHKKEGHDNFLDKILECQNLLNIMNQKKINPPTKLKEYFVFSKKIKKYQEIANVFNLIKNDILMFKEVIVGNILENSKERGKNKGFDIIKKFRTITCIDFDNTKKCIEDIIEEKEVAPKDYKIIKTEEESEFIENK